jgi:hypothetical protein
VPINVFDDVNVGRPCVQAVDLDEGRTLTVVGSDSLPVVRVEEWLEYVRRAEGASPCSGLPSDGVVQPRVFFAKRKVLDVEATQVGPTAAGEIGLAGA